MRTEEEIQERMALLEGEVSDLRADVEALISHLGLEREDPEDEWTNHELDEGEDWQEE